LISIDAAKKSARQFYPAGFHSGWNVDRSTVTICNFDHTNVVGLTLIEIEFDDATWILQVAKSIE
jgi:hypothetical protein